MSGKPVEIVVRPTAYVIGAILTALITVFIQYVALFTPGGTLWGLNSEVWSNSWVGSMSFVLFWPLVIAVLGTLLSRLGVTKHELVIILSMIWMTWLIPSYYGILGVLT
ncbi:MAG: hypothetical protein RMJ00_06725, partial [Nitrososphaerota archaeon]|nr:hypothetical protein [Nitrososphaerota archaeon]